MKSLALALATVACLALAASHANAAVVAQYSFENNQLDTAAGGTTLDNLTYVQGGSTSATAQYTTGVVGSAGVFDGNYFTALDSADLSLNDNTWTIELFLLVDTHNGEWDRLVLKWDASHDYHLALRNKDVDMFDSSVSNVIPQQNTTPDTDFTDGWHHIAVTSSASGSEVWIDGESVFTGGAITLADGTDNLGLGDAGSGPDANFRLKGFMDEMLIHDMAVDQTYVSARAAMLEGPGDVPAPAALPAGLAMMAAIAARRRRN